MQQTTEVHRNPERKKLKAASIEKVAGKQLKQTRITMKISKQRPHKFTLAKNTSKFAARVSRSTMTLTKIKT